MKQPPKRQSASALDQAFYGVEQSVELIRETVYAPEPVDEDWLRSEIDAAFAEHRRQAADWPDQTDCDPP